MPAQVQPGTPRLRKPRQAKPRQAAASQAAASQVKPRAYVLPESLTIRDAREFVKTMREVCTHSVPLLDGSAVAEVDTAGLQVLVAAAVAARVAGPGLRWSATSPALQHAVDGFGLGACLGLETAAELAVVAPGQG